MGADEKAAKEWMPKEIAGIPKLRCRRIRIIRDYSRFDRREAPQYYDDVPAREDGGSRGRTS
jgi:hypothetical protein